MWAPNSSVINVIPPAPVDLSDILLVALRSQRQEVPLWPLLEIQSKVIPPDNFRVKGSLAAPQFANFRATVTNTDNHALPSVKIINSWELRKLDRMT